MRVPAMRREAERHAVQFAASATSAANPDVSRSDRPPNRTVAAEAGAKVECPGQGLQAGHARGHRMGNMGFELHHPHPGRAGQHARRGSGRAHRQVRAEAGRGEVLNHRNHLQVAEAGHSGMGSI